MIQIYCLSIKNDIWTNLDTKLLNYISDERKNRILNFHNIKDRKLSLYSALLTRMTLCKRLNINNENLHFFYSLSKPVLHNKSNLNFSISHSQNLIVVSFSKKKIGIDIEIIQNPPFCLINDIFHSVECEYINDINYLKAIRFFEVWTRKEAFGKYHKVGLCYDLKNFNTLSKNERNNFYTVKYGDYILSVYSQNISSIEFINITESEINNYFIK